MSLLFSNQMTAQLTQMLKLQDSLNRVVAEDWRTRGFAWHRAIMVEAVEFMEHLGQWKWWKKGKPDYAQARMELVDIWHFILSQLMVESPALPLDTLAYDMLERASLLASFETAPCPFEVPIEAVHDAVDALVRSSVSRHIKLQPFCLLMQALDLNFDALYKLYIGKNVLNRFRQTHGYKTGTYSKMWDGKEDNEHLSEILEALPPDGRLESAVSDALASRYASLMTH